MTAPRIRVVFAILEAGQDLARSLAAIRRERDLDVVVVDRGSRDTFTRDLLARLGAEGTDCRVAEGTVAAAWNAGLADASCPYFLGLEAGDVVRPAALARWIAALEKDEGAGFVAAASPWPLTPAAVLAQAGPGEAPIVRVKALRERSGFDAMLEDRASDELLIRIVASGARGLRADEPLLEKRVRLDFRGRLAFTARRHVDATARILLKHRPLFESAAADLMAEQEAQMTALEGEERALGAPRPTGSVAPFRWRDLEALHAEPVSRVWGLERGRPLDRYYIENFLERHRADIRGCVLEMKDPGYTRQFGDDWITRSEVLDIDPDNPSATLVADLADAADVPSDAFDCFILTETLHAIFDVRAAVREAVRVIKPGGVLLCTVPCIARSAPEDGGREAGEYWRFTESAVRRLFSEVLPPGSFEISQFGNAKAGAAFWLGLAAEDLSREELDVADPYYPVTLCVRAVKPQGAVRASPRGALVLGYHRVSSDQPDALTLSPQEFASQMEAVRRNYTPIALEELLGEVLAGRAAPGAVAVTFDDGTLDALETVAPILEGAGVPGTFFVNARGLDAEEEPWWSVLDRIFAGAVPAKLVFAWPGGTALSVNTAAPAGREAARREVGEIFFRMDAGERASALRRIARWAGVDADSPPRRTHRTLLSAEVVALAKRRGVAIGAHGVDHLWLTRMSRAAQREEILGSRKRLEALLGAAPATFAYPYGAEEPATRELVREFGFRAAFTTRPGLVRPGVDPFGVPRWIVDAAEKNFAETLRGRLC